MTALNLKTTAIIFILLASILFFSTSVIAAPGNSSQIKPGWGYGDTNHVHVGPAGQSVIPTNITINQSNNINLSNNLSFSSNTGNNTGSSILTGSSHIFVSILNFLGLNKS